MFLVGRLSRLQGLLIKCGKKEGQLKRSASPLDLPECFEETHDSVEARNAVLGQDILQDEGHEGNHRVDLSTVAFELRTPICFPGGRETPTLQENIQSTYV